MELFYFGRSTQPLFGVYHPPGVGRIWMESHAVLLCNPIFETGFSR